MSAFNGPLHPHPDNPRYFTDGSGKAVYLTGSHTWAAFQERTYPGLPAFDYDRFLDHMQEWNHNFLRLWTWEHSAWMQFTDKENKVLYFPNWYQRTGPGNALDGLPKFDLTKFDQATFDRLRERVVKAGEHGIYVSVMFFQGFSVEQKQELWPKADPVSGNPWEGHPFHRDNNSNGIDGDPDNMNQGFKTHQLAVPEITSLQETFVKKVIDTLGDSDHVLWEISNESHGDSRRWQYHMINLVKTYEKDKPKQHPVGMTFHLSPGNRGTNQDLWQSNADWVSPSSDDGYRNNPPAANGSKVVVADTDHIDPWMNYIDHTWPWKCLLRGLHPIVMDEYMDIRFFPKGTDQPAPRFDPVRKAMGRTLKIAQKIDLVKMTPQNNLASTGYCLADPGNEYLVYLPEGGSVTIDLSGVKGQLQADWYDPERDSFNKGEKAKGGKKQEFTCPINSHALLYLKLK